MAITITKGRRININQASDVISEYVWIRSTLMVGVNSAYTTKVVFGDLSVELIQIEVFRALHHAQAR